MNADIIWAPAINSLNEGVVYNEMDLPGFLLPLESPDSGQGTRDT